MAPDPQGQQTTDGGVIIPMGNAVSSDVTNTALLYNEYPYSCQSRMCLGVSFNLVGAYSQQ